MENNQTPKLVTRAHLFARLEVTQLPPQAAKPEAEQPASAAESTSEEENEE